MFDTIGDREETIAKYTPFVKAGARVAILLPIRYGGRAATGVSFELDEGTFEAGVETRLVRTHFWTQVSAG